MEHTYLNKEKVTIAFMANQITVKEKEELTKTILSCEEFNKMLHHKIAQAS
ncbi:MAG: hypothetical protein WBF77_05620 [Sulfurimonadaceae bacterium]